MRWQKHLRMTPHPNMTTAELVLEAGVDPLDSRALVVAPLFGKHVAKSASRSRLALHRFVAFGRAAGVDVDDRHVAKLPAVGPYLLSIVSGVHQVIEIVDPPSRQACQWNGPLESHASTPRSRDS